MSEDYLTAIGIKDGIPGTALAREQNFRNLTNGLKMQTEDGTILQPFVGEVQFKDGTSVQEDIVLQPALEYRIMARAAEDGSPYKLIGWNDLSGDAPSIYHIAHNEAIHSMQEMKSVTAVSKDEEMAGIKYANEMSNAFYNMFANFEKQGKNPGFLGWSYNADMVNFTAKWMKEFEKLSPASRVVATFKFLEGTHGRVSQRRFTHHLPPVSGRSTGISLLDANTMKKYFNLYNEVLTDAEYRLQRDVREKSDFASYTWLQKKKGCK